MLQVHKSPAVFEPETGPSGFVPPSDFVVEILNTVRRQYPIIIFILALAIGVGGFYVLTTPPTFTASATLLIDTRKNQLFQQQSVLSDIPVDTASVESQVQILRSETIALAVIKEFHLAESPDFAGSGGFLASLVGGVAGLFPTGTPPSEFEKLRATAEAFASRLSVRRVGLTYILEISFQSLSPDQAANIANAVANAYITDLLDAKYKATRRASLWLQDRIRELREQSTAAERAVVEFKTRNNIVQSAGRLMNEQELTEINSQLVVARSQLAEAKARLDQIQAVVSANSPDAAVSATVTDTLNNQVITKLRSQYLDLANKERDWSTRYGSNHLAAVNLRNQMREIRVSILDELKRLSESYKSDYEIAKQRADAAEKQFAQSVTQSQTTNQAQVVLRDLESTAQTYRALYDNFLQRYMESVQQQSFPITEARLITEASRPLRKSSPRTTLVLAFAGFGGLAMGFAAARFLDVSDRVFRTSNQVETLLNAKCISVLPLLPKTSKASPAPSADAPPGSQVIARNEGLFWHVINSPFSRFTESIRTIKVAADLEFGARSTKVIGFTSALPNEGKSTIAAAFAHLVAQSGARTILIDGDLRNPSLSRTLTGTTKVGLQDAIAGSVRFEAALWTDPVTGLDFLPAATRLRVAHTSEILASDAAKALFQRMRSSYEYVVVDLSPLAPVVDVRTTINFVDSFFFVIEWGRTKIDIVEHALHDAPGVFERVSGVVLNKADLGTLSRYGHYSYYKNKYYHRYGYTD